MFFFFLLSFSSPDFSVNFLSPLFLQVLLSHNQIKRSLFQSAIVGVSTAFVKVKLSQGGRSSVSTYIVGKNGRILSWVVYSPTQKSMLA